MAHYQCPECDETYDDFTAYCHECGTRTEVVADYENPEDTLTDKI